jgi:hypothetical protein
MEAARPQRCCSSRTRRPSLAHAAVLFPLSSSGSDPARPPLDPNARGTPGAQMPRRLREGNEKLLESLLLRTGVCSLLLHNADAARESAGDRLTRFLVSTFLLYLLPVLEKMTLDFKRMEFTIELACFKNQNALHTRKISLTHCTKVYMCFFLSFAEHIQQTFHILSKC